MKTSEILVKVGTKSALIIVLLFASIVIVSVIAFALVVFLLYVFVMFLAASFGVKFAQEWFQATFKGLPDSMSFIPHS